MVLSTQAQTHIVSPISQETSREISFLEKPFSEWVVLSPLEIHGELKKLSGSVDLADLWAGFYHPELKLFVVIAHLFDGLEQNQHKVFLCHRFGWIEYEIISETSIIEGHPMIDEKSVAETLQLFRSSILTDEEYVYVHLGIFDTWVRKTLEAHREVS